MGGKRHKKKREKKEKTNPELDNKKAEEYLNQGNIYAKSSDIPRAIINFKNAIGCDPQLFQGHNNLGMMYELVKSDQEAINEYQQAIKINPEYLPAKSNLAALYERIGRYEEAIQVYCRIAEISPQYRQAALQKVLALESASKIKNQEPENKNQELKDYYKLNCKLLLKRYPPTLKTYLDSVDISTVSTSTSRTGFPTLSIKNIEGNWVRLHSQFDPIKEAGQQVTNIDLTKTNFIVLYGLGLGYLLESIIKTVNNRTKILVIEPNPATFKSALTLRDLTPLLSSPNIYISVGEDLKQFETTWHNFFDLSTVTKLATVDHAASYQLYKDYFNKVKKIINIAISKTASNLMTMMNEGLGYQLNTLRSIGHIINNPGVKTLFNLFPKKPIIIVGAGPSLDKNIYLLPMVKDRAVIIAVETALKPLLARGIEPHLVVTADPSIHNYRHLFAVDVKKAYLVAEPMVLPDSISDYPGKKFIASFNDKMMNYLTKYLGDKGHLSVWGSISTMAFDLARKMGGDPIIFIGQDLAFTGGRTYCRWTYKEDQWLDRIDRNYTMEDIMRDELRQRRLKEGIDIYGQPILLEEQLLSYYSWLVDEIKKTKAKCINATEGGILKEGIEIMTLEEAICRYCKEVFEVEGLLDKAHSNYKVTSPEPLKKSLRGATLSLNKILKNCQGGMDKAREVINIMAENDKNNIPLLQKYASELQGYKDFISKDSEVIPFLEMGGQAGLVAFHRRLKGLEGRKFDYSFLRDGAQYYGDLFASVVEVCEQFIPAFEEAVGLDIFPK
ncbi:MAG: 6-hydroxymethylpterin diphosphokinase MptE-like protein [bacterium]